MLFYLNNDEKTKIKPVKPSTFADLGWSEKDLENLISTNITRLIPENQLMVLFQERPFDEAADIYALDKKGDLYIFELKRWKGYQENILQVLRYGQIYGQYSYEQLQDLLRKYKNLPSIDLSEKHFDYFKELLDSKLSPHEFNREQHFIVITNGTDLDTLNAIKYWEEKGLKIESIIYRIYTVGNEMIFEFNPYNPENELIIEEEEGYFIVNTNITWSQSNYKEMLNQEKAAGYYDRKYGISNIKKGDTVFLYHTGVGIVAYGKTIDTFKMADADGNKDEEYYIKLKFDWKIDPDTESNRAVKSWEINDKLKSGYRFRQTVFSVSEDMAEIIKELSKTK
jgi:hypothetical protein